MKNKKRKRGEQTDEKRDMFFEKAKQIKLNVLLQTLSQKGTTKNKSVQKVKINNRF